MPRYIVVKRHITINGRVKFKTSKSPKPHEDKFAAVAEASRLSEKEKKDFSVFEEVATIPYLAK